MRKLVIAALVVFCAFCVVRAYAGTVEDIVKNKLQVGIEYNSGEKNIENLNAITVGVGGFLSGAIDIKSSDVQLREELATVGYKLSDMLTPYAVVGMSQLSMEQTLTGELVLPFWSGSALLTKNEIRDGAFTYGGGAKGKLLTIKGVDLGYDVRYIMAKFEENDERLMILPDYTNFSLRNEQVVDYSEASLSLVASKEIALKTAKTQDADGKWRNAAGEYAEAPTKLEKLTPISVTPYIGYRVSKVDMSKENHLELGPIAVGTETNLEGISNSALVGASVKLTKNIDIAAGAVINKNVGVSAKVTYSF